MKETIISVFSMRGSDHTTEENLRQKVQNRKIKPCIQRIKECT